MKNNGLIITAIILLSIVVFLLVMFLVMCLTGRISFRGIMFGFGSKSANVIYDNQFNLEDIQNIEIREDAGDIIIKETSENYIKVVLYGEDSNDAKVELNSGKLNVDNTHKKNRIIFGGRKNGIEIYLPSSYANEIKIKNDYGNCEITDLENATLNIDCDAGNVEIGKVKNATIKCDYGNVEAKEILNKCDIKANCGNISIDRISIQEDSSIKADLGNIDINNTNDIYIEANVDLGKTNIANSNRNSNVTLKVKCDCGNVTIK